MRDLLELGPGQGRDTLLFAGAGLHVVALDADRGPIAQTAQRWSPKYNGRAISHLAGVASRTISQAASRSAVGPASSAIVRGGD